MEVEVEVGGGGIQKKRERKKERMYVCMWCVCVCVRMIDEWKRMEENGRRDRYPADGWASHRHRHRHHQIHWSTQLELFNLKLNSI